MYSHVHTYKHTTHTERKKDYTKTHSKTFLTEASNRNIKREQLFYNREIDFPLR